MVGLAAPPVRQHLGINARAARERVTEFFHHHESRALAEQKPVARGVKGAHCPGRILPLAGHYLAHAEPAPGRLDERRLRATGDHHIDVLVLHHAQRIADRVISRGAARANRDGVSFHTQFIGNLAAAGARCAADHARHRHSAVSFAPESVFRFEGCLVVAHRGSLRDAASIRIDL